MENKERDIWDDAIQSKLEDFEVDMLPNDWEAIADRLPQVAPVIPLRRRISYWVAAAVVSLLVITGGVYFYDNEWKSPVAQEIPWEDDALPAVKETIPVVEEEIRNESAIARPTLLAKVNERSGRKRLRPVAMPVHEAVGAADNDVKAVAWVEDEVEDEKAVDPQQEVVVSEEVPMEVQHEEQVAVAPATEPKRAPKKNRRWSFGMGGGSFSASSDHLMPQYVTNSTVLKSENLEVLNAIHPHKMTLAKTDIKHKTPIGFGFSVGYQLNKRFSLQSGLNYSYLRSEWSTNNTYHVDNDQCLHFIGIPLSLAFQIAEWNKFRFYTSAGVMAEVNVAGKRKMTLYSDDVKIMSNSEHVRMKEWLWSVNARAGVSYPIVRFVSAFAEIGAGYYLDNGSEIETIHSEKPFNVSMQLGFRFGF